MSGPYFAPIPNRAIYDDRLGFMHMRVLGCITMHDRMGRNGRHCLLSNRRIGEKLDMDFSNVAKCVRDLIEWGYLARLANPDHKQRQQLMTVYDEAADLRAIKENRGITEPRLDTLNRGMGTPHIRDTPEGDIIDAGEPAPIWKSELCPSSKSSEAEQDAFIARVLRTTDDAAFLGQLSRAAERGCLFHEAFGYDLWQRLDSIHTTYDVSDPLSGWAYRLLETELTRG